VNSPALLKVLQLANQGHTISFAFEPAHQRYRIIASRVGRTDYDRMYIDRAEIVQAAESEQLDVSVLKQLDRVW
jgi:hypothetical protein